MHYLLNTEVSYEMSDMNNALVNLEIALGVFTFAVTNYFYFHLGKSELNKFGKKFNVY